MRTVQMYQVNFLVHEDWPPDTRRPHMIGCSHDDSWHEVPFARIAGGVRPHMAGDSPSRARSYVGAGKRGERTRGFPRKERHVSSRRRSTPVSVRSGILV
jgi:hypothetical protein